MSDHNQQKSFQGSVIPPALQEQATEDVRLAAEEQHVQPKATQEQAQEILIRSLLAREARLAQKELAEEEKKTTLGKQRALNAKNRTQRLFIKQQRCTHLKGGKVKARTGVRDFALFHHMYIDLDRLIGCFICKMRWRPKDTDEYLIRDGRKIRNHTKIGWAKALEMFEQSSNTLTSSEIPIRGKDEDIVGGEDIGPAEAQ